MKVEEFVVIISLNLLDLEYLLKTLHQTTPLYNSEEFVKNQALIYLSDYGKLKANTQDGNLNGPTKQTN